MIHFANDDTAQRNASPAPRDAGACATSTVDGNAATTCGGETAALEQLGDDIAELAAHLHAATYRLLVMLAEFDRRGGWGGGFRSCAHWLSWRTRIDLGAAREKVRVARALEQLPQLSDALRRGELSYAVVRAVTRIATPQNESELLALARHGTASHVERVVRAWRRVDRLEEQFAERERHRSRHLHLYPDDDGMYELRARLPAEVGALLERALAAASEVLYAESNREPSMNHDQTSFAQREADAIGLVAEWALGRGAAGPIEQKEEILEPAHASAECRTDAAQLTADCLQVIDDGAQNARCGESDASEHGPAADEDASDAAKVDSRVRPTNVGRAERFQVVVHVDAEALRAGSDSGQAVLAGGVRLSAETCRRIACDCSRVIMVHGRDSNVLDVGRRTRVVPTPIRRALEHRDRGCRFPGCNRRICDAHHVRHWADGGKTRLSNLALLCRAHHKAVHEDGFGMHTAADGKILFTRPDGRSLPEIPASPTLQAGCVDRLIAAHQELGVDINPWTAHRRGSASGWIWTTQSAACELFEPHSRHPEDAPGGHFKLLHSWPG